MSLENVKLFYEKISSDKYFSAEIQGATNKEECSHIVKMAGFEFTQIEFEEYTTQILEVGSSNQDFQSLDERELAAVVGGIKGIIGFPPIIMHYGVVLPPEIWDI